MTTETDELEDAPITPSDEAEMGMPSSFYEAARSGDPLPSSRYDGCTTPSEVNDRFKAAFAEAEAELGPHLWTNPDWRARRNELGEDMRRAHARLARNGGINTPKKTRSPRVDVGEVHPVSNTEPVTCTGKCGETKPANKFPTLTGGRPGRASECRACRDARLAEARLDGLS